MIIDIVLSFLLLNPNDNFFQCPPQQKKKSANNLKCHILITKMPQSHTVEWKQFGSLHMDRFVTAVAVINEPQTVSYL